MSRAQSVLQDQRVEPQHGARRLDVADRPRQGWLTVKDLREALRFPSDKAVRSWLGRQRIASVRRGRVILVSAVDVDHALRG